VYAALHIRFQEDISRFLPENKDNQRINEAYRLVASSNKVIVYLAAKSAKSAKSAKDAKDVKAANEVDDEAAREMLIEATDALAERLSERMDSSFVESVFYAVHPEDMIAVSSFVIANMPYFLDADDYLRMDTLLSREAVRRQLEANLNILSSSAGLIVRNNLLADPLQISAGLMRQLRDFRAGDSFELYEDHLFTRDGEALIFIDCNIPASETARNEVFLDSLQAIVAETESAFKDVKISHFGASEIGLANSSRIKADTMFSVSLAVVVMLALLVYSFRSGRKILLIFASVAFGGLFAAALLYTIRGEVSVIAVGISSIMFGIAINYPLHFLEHHKHVGQARSVIKDIIEPLTIGNITTVGAFLSLVFIGSNAMSDLGLFASLLLLCTIFFVLFFLPHLIDDKMIADPSSARDSWSDKLAGTPFEKNRLIVSAILLLTVFFGFYSGGSRFETDMQKINYMTEEQRASFNKMSGLLSNERHLMYYVSEGRTLDEALRHNEQNMPQVRALLDSGIVHKISGVGCFYPSREMQSLKLKRWEEFWQPRRDSLRAALRDEAAAAGFRADAFDSFEEMIARKWEIVEASHFEPVREMLAKNYLIEKDGKAMVVNMLYINREDAQQLEAALNARNAASIAFDAGSITRRMVASLSDNFNYVLYVCGFIVFSFLIFSMGRLELSLIAFTPLALSWIWILGMMNICDIRFNIVNIILATFIFGQGDDYTIFMTEGLMYEYAYGRKMLASYKKSIFMSALIMLVGMGMLIFAEHPALRSLAQVTVIGMFSVVIMSYIFPSLLFRLLTMKKGRKRIIPVTLRNLLCMVYVFVIFLIISLIMTVWGFVICHFKFKIFSESANASSNVSSSSNASSNSNATASSNVSSNVSSSSISTSSSSSNAKYNSKFLYHRLLYRLARYFLFHFPQVRTTFLNLSGETFRRPGVIICNHQSHLDLMCVMMLTPKLIILTNDWVWNSPFYGRLIKYADYYPVSDGIEKAIDRLQGAVDRGYSIVVFPEGTRSDDCSILRFHRGAFYLAEKLHLDLIPVIIHGVGHVLPKNDFMLRKGQMHIQVMPRISPEDPRFASHYSARSREVRHYYREEYEKLRIAIETPDYYADKVIHNYLYKGPAVERAVRRSLRRNRNFAAEIERMPDEGEVEIRNVGYGEYPLLLAFVKPRLRIIALESDPDRLAIATNVPSLPENLRYKM
ncbi:MAG: 1-acyl-sn-glycerol-3-phosphate acyltransferase, partial [Tannerella sp.]|nr:1-acyl-sn-glycerol-3-phosphate acyltransferase [Tannerella sp.]